MMDEESREIYPAFFLPGFDSSEVWCIYSTSSCLRLLPNLVSELITPHLVSSSPSPTLPCVFLGVTSQTNHSACKLLSLGLFWDNPIWNTWQNWCFHCTQVFFIYFNWRIIALQYYVGFSHINMNQPYMCMCIHVSPPSHLPPHPTPLGCHRALDLSSLQIPTGYNFTYVILHMVTYMFQCYSLTQVFKHGSEFTL